MNDARHNVAEGLRIVLRPLRETDVSAAYLGWMNDQEVTHGLESRFHRHTAESLRDFVRAVNQSGDHVFWAIVLRVDGRHIGNLKLGPIDRNHGTAEMGLMIGEKNCWGKGLGSEAIAVATEYAFSRLDLRKLTAGSYADNPGSVKAFLKAGWIQEAILREQFLREGRPVDGIRLAVLAGAWSNPESRARKDREGND